MMKSLIEVFPTTINQLCRWHVEQNIMKNCRKYFSSVADFDIFMKQIQKIASSTDATCQKEELKQLKDKFPIPAANYFFDQWWANGLCESWAEIKIQKYSNFGIRTTSTVEGSYGALKGALPSSSGTLHTATKIINRKGTERSQQLSVIESNKNLLVRLEIRNQIETSTLCTAISRSALEMVYAEVAKKLQHQEKDGTTEKCSCTIRSLYLLPVQTALPAINVLSQHIDPVVLAVLKDPLAAIPRRGTSAEIVQQSSDRIEKVRRCGSCHRAGHDRRSYPKLNNIQTGPNQLRGNRYPTNASASNHYTGSTSETQYKTPKVHSYKPHYPEDC
ncbi:hypothetical protein V1507DRAFT_499334 [Lipomyces tetrasporus]